MREDEPALPARWARARALGSGREGSVLPKPAERNDYKCKVHAVAGMLENTGVRREVPAETA
jgi:hypothetical protein